MEKKQRTTFLPDIGKLQPQARDVEEAVLGSLLIEKNAIDEVSSVLTAEDFYDNSNGVIYKSILDLNRRNKPIDILTVVEELKRSGKLEDIGGPLYIAELSSKVASSYHVKEHAYILLERSIKRKIISLSSKISEDSFDDRTDIEDILHELSNELDKITEKFLGKSTGDHISVPAREAIEGMYKRIELAKNNIRSGIDTGLCDLNKLVNGWQNSEMVVIAARPSMGKTAIMLHFARAAAYNGIPVVLFSLEMSAVSLADRLILSESMIDPDSYKSGHMTQEDANKVEKAMNTIYHLPMHVDSNPSVTMSYIRTKCKQLKKQGNCGIIMIDYLQLAEGEGNEHNREVEVAKMSRTAKKIAKELDVPLILLAQLNRSCEARTDKKPLLSDLRESGAIEQDADMVCFVYRPEYYKISPINPNTGLPEENYGEFIIAKNRNGGTGIVKFKHNKGMTRFFDYDPRGGMPF